MYNSFTRSELYRCMEGFEEGWWQTPGGGQQPRSSWADIVQLAGGSTAVKVTIGQIGYLQCACVC